MTPKFFTYWLTGLSGAGKTTLANAMAQHLRTQGQAVCVLDGDALWSLPVLGFTELDRAASKNSMGALPLGLALNIEQNQILKDTAP